MNVVEDGLLDGCVADYRKMPKVKWLRQLPAVDETVQRTLGRSAVVFSKQNPVNVLNIP